MKQLVFDFYREMLEQEAFMQLTKMAIIESCYDKNNYPKCLEDLTDDEMKEAFGENTFNIYKEDGDWDKIKSGHLIVLRRCKKDGKTISMKEMILYSSRNYQKEMICSIVGSCLAVPEELLKKYIIEGKSIKRISDVFKYPKTGVKLRLIKFYFDNVIYPLGNYE